MTSLDSQTGSPSSTQTTASQPAQTAQPRPAPAPPAGEAPPSPVTAPPLGVRLNRLRDRATRSTPNSGDRPEQIGDARDPLDDPANRGTTRSSSSGGPAPVKLDKDALRELARSLVLILSEFVHDHAATHDDERAAGLWIAEDKEQAAIGDPAANIAARHSINAINRDTADLIAAGLGVLGYGAKNVRKAWTMRRGRRQLAQVDPIISENGDQS